MTLTKIIPCEDRTYHHYADTIKRAKKASYKLAGFGQIGALKAASKAIIVRHDIDFSPKHALKLASIEYSLDVSATYFVSMHREHYTPMTRAMRKTVHAIIELGHEIGLHYEPEFDDLQAEINLLEHYLDCKLVAIARHNPFGIHIDVDKQSKPKNVIDAYSDEIMSEFKYITDSSGIWREGCWCGWLGKKDKLQVLTHPEWHSLKTNDPVLQLEKINRAWMADNERHAAIAIDNLKLHRQKITEGKA